MSGYLDYVGSQLELEFVSISSHVNNCPFRGCAGDWVKLGVAKRHGAVLGDAICLNSSLPCVIDVKWVNLAVVCQDAQITGGTRQKKSFTLCRVMPKSSVCMKNSYGTRI